MWSQTYSTTVSDLSQARLWAVWSDVNQWHTWQDDIEYARLQGAFAVGQLLDFRPKGGPRIAIELVEVEPGRRFTDLTRFPGARMYGCHEFIERPEGVEIRTTLRVEGPLGFLWRKIVAEGIVKGLPAQTASLIQRVRDVG